MGSFRGKHRAVARALFCDEAVQLRATATHKTRLSHAVFLESAASAVDVTSQSRSLFHTQSSSSQSPSIGRGMPQECTHQSPLRPTPRMRQRLSRRAMPPRARFPPRSVRPAPGCRSKSGWHVACCGLRWRVDLRWRTGVGHGRGRSWGCGKLSIVWLVLRLTSSFESVHPDRVRKGTV